MQGLDSLGNNLQQIDWCVTEALRLIDNAWPSMLPNQ